MFNMLRWLLAHNGLCKSSGGFSIDFLSAWTRKSDGNPTLIQPQLPRHCF